MYCTLITLELIGNCLAYEWLQLTGDTYGNLLTLSTIAYAGPVDVLMSFPIDNEGHLESWIITVNILLKFKAYVNSCSVLLFYKIAYFLSSFLD